MTVSKTPAPKPVAAAPAKAGKTAAKSKLDAHEGSGADVATVDAASAHTQSSFSDRFAPPKPPSRGAVQLDSDNMPHKMPGSPAKADPKLASAWKTKSAAELSDAEVLAMPEGEYMNPKQIEFFRVKLTKLKDDVLSNAGETTEHLREDTTIVPDPADRATIEEEHALELRTRDRERKLLKKIVQSLARLDSGDYGYCDETGEPIGLGRLIARPTATLSLEAQQRRELKQKMFGD
jgi:DnaK suppressor protein